jgi:hypothetical protein
VLGSQLAGGPPVASPARDCPQNPPCLRRSMSSETPRPGLHAGSAEARTGGAAGAGPSWSCPCGHKTARARHSAVAQSKRGQQLRTKLYLAAKQLAHAAAYPLGCAADPTISNERRPTLSPAQTTASGLQVVSPAEFVDSLRSLAVKALATSAQLLDTILMQRVPPGMQHAVPSLAFCSPGRPKAEVYWLDVA